MITIRQFYEQLDRIAPSPVPRGGIMWASWWVTRVRLSPVRCSA
jgi:hypothetical protein